jgi:outer membrane protein TolC
MVNTAMVSFLMRFVLNVSLICISIAAFSQPGNQPQQGNLPDTALTLDQCIGYALKNQPTINQAIINVAITRATNAINTSGWLPQVGVSGNLTHYLTLPTNFIKNANTGTITEQRTGVINTFNPVGSVTQTIFNPSLLYAVRAAPLYV